jgi:transforming growth factor-beta-induced protein
MSNNNIWNFTSNSEGRSIWQLVSTAGDLIGQSSQSFASKAGAEYNAKLLGYKESFSKQLVWDFFEGDNLWNWTCHNTVNKEEVGKSIKGFDSEIAAMDNATNFGFSSSGYSMRTAVIDEGALKSNFGNVEPLKVELPKTSIDIPNTSMSSIGRVTPIISEKSFVDLNSELKKPQAGIGVPLSNINNNDGSSDLGSLTLNRMWKWFLPLLIALLLIGLLWWFFNNNKMTDNKLVITNLSSTTSKVVTNNILNLIQKPEFSTLNTALKSSGLEKALNSFGPLTLLAPTNSAFEKLPEGTFAELLKPEKTVDLQNLLKVHVLPGNIDLSAVKDGDMLKTFAGEMLKAEIIDGKLKVGNVLNIDTQKKSTEGSINVHSIGDVLSAPKKYFDTTSSALTNFSSASSTVSSMEAEKLTENKSSYFLNIAKEDGRFGTLISLVKLAGLDSALDQPGLFTIFAPTDEAFNSLGAETLESLQKPENKDKLASILKYHVVSGKNSFDKFTANTQLTTLNGNSVTLGLDEHNQGIVKGSKNTALAPVEDINTDNAVIHILTDTPLLQ